MPNENQLTGRIRSALKKHRGISERKMFGGTCFFANGNMIGGPTGHDRLVIRVGPDRYLECLDLVHASEMDFTGRPMKGFVYVDPQGINTDQQLKEWLMRGLKYARTLPAK